MKQIALTKGQVAIVDDDDYEYLIQWSWYFNQGYAVRNSSTVNGKRHTVCMHREILRNKTILNMEIDHIDGNGINNQKSKLRICEHKENSRNRKTQKTYNTPGYKGVSFHNNKWRARIGVNGKEILLGQFNNIEDAVSAYDLAAKQYFGEFANTNR